MKIFDIVLAGTFVALGVVAGFQDGRDYQKHHRLPIILDPSGDFGAVCDGQHDDTVELGRATNLAAKIGAIVQLPPNCVFGGIVLPGKPTSSSGQGDDE